MAVSIDALRGAGDNQDILESFVEPRHTLLSYVLLKGEVGVCTALPSTRALLSRHRPVLCSPRQPDLAIYYAVGCSANRS